MPLTPTRSVLAGAAVLAALGGCSSAAGSAASPGFGATGAPAPLTVVASFYPLEFAVQQIGGAQVRVTGLTKPGAEPHDVELSPKDVAAVSRGALVVYAQGFQPSVDTAVEQEAEGHALDVGPVADLDLVAPAEGGHEAPEAAPPATAPAGTDVAGRDPHFWLDPVRYAAVVAEIGRRMAAVDPAHAATYTAGAADLVARLQTLDRDFAGGLQHCDRRDLVTAHAAFGYLSQRYGFTQVSISGLSPDVEPSGATLAGVADFVRQHYVTTIYAETLVEPAFAETVAHTTGATLATLDPLEGLTTASAGHDYLEVMRANLATLRAGQGCS